MKNKKRLVKCAIIACLLVTSYINSQELVIGEERLEQGIVMIFEGAIKDHIEPTNRHLGVADTNVHLEARVNWDVTNIPTGTPAGGFVPYLHISAKVTNTRTGQTSFVDLVPHINLIDNFHYARNISLPGDNADLYNVAFKIMPPTFIDLSFHKDWVQIYGAYLIKEVVFNYKSVSFNEIANANRK